MRDDQDIRREGRTVSSRAADYDDKRAGKSAQTRVEKRAGKTTEREIVGNKLWWTREYVPKIAPEKLSAHTRYRFCYRRRDKERKV